MSKIIEATFEVDGSVEIDAQGFQGAECERATKPLEEALGKVSERKLKPERQTVAQKERSRA